MGKKPIEDELAFFFGDDSPIPNEPPKGTPPASDSEKPGTGISISVWRENGEIKTEVREIPITDEEREQWAREEAERRERMREYYDSLPPEIKDRLFVTPDECDGITQLRQYVKFVCEELKIPVPKMKRKQK